MFVSADGSLNSFLIFLLQKRTRHLIVSFGDSLYDMTNSVSGKNKRKCQLLFDDFACSML